MARVYGATAAQALANAGLIAAPSEMYALIERIIEGPIDGANVDAWDALKARIDQGVTHG